MLLRGRCLTKVGDVGGPSTIWSLALRVCAYADRDSDGVSEASLTAMSLTT